MSDAELIYYIKLIRESSQPLEPLPVILSAEWEALIPKKGEPVFKGIRAVLFDLYGTLFISGAGEISTGMMSGTTMEPGIISEMSEYFRSAVKQRHEKAHAKGIVWPEVRVEEIWADYKGTIPSCWESLQKMQRFPDKIGPKTSVRCTGREIALRYELAVNPVYPMPYAEKVLRTLIANGVKLGIISNAQFYTPFLFNAFFSASPAELGFDPELLLYSFMENEAKPSPRLFAKAKEHLAQYDIKPDETLYIGNDMKNDVISAAGEGFITAFFAGDRRSLRLREDDPACAGKRPDIVIRDLQALEKVRPLE
ncbi:MAG: HAD family hydrolase [Treponema sp.]|nr:HAD family hydrolase [Treponema sp.]